MLFLILFFSFNLCFSDVVIGISTGDLTEEFELGSSSLGGKAFEGLLKTVGLLFTKSNTSPLPDLGASRKVSDVTNRSDFWDVTAFLFRLRAQEDFLHVAGVTFKVLDQLMVITIIFALHEAVDFHLVLDEVGSLFELIEGLTRVVKDEEVEELLQMLLKVAFTVLINCTFEHLPEWLCVCLLCSRYR